MSALHTAIAQRFCQPEWATFFEVRDATGFDGQGRSADAVAMNCYPSRGLEVHGFEVKSARGDFLRELKSPAKSAAVQKYCDRWWIVTTEEVVKGADLMPPTWGLMLLKGGQLRIATQAPKLDATPISRSFMASMLRAAAKDSETKIPALVAAEKQRLQQESRDHVQQQLLARRDQSGEMVKLFERIKDETGIDLHEWRTSYHLLPAIKLALKIREMHVLERIFTASKEARRFADGIDTLTEEIKALVQPDLDP